MRAIFHIRNQNGSSLISMLVGAAIMGVLSLGAASFFKNQSDSQMRLARKYEAIDLRRNLEGIFSNVETCNCQFKGIRIEKNGSVLSRTKVLSIKAGCAVDSPMLVAPNMKVGLGGASLTIADLSLDSFVVGSDGVLKSQLEVRFKEDPTLLIPAPLRMTQIFLLAADGSIESCRATSEVSQDMLRQICENFQGVFDISDGSCRLLPKQASCPAGAVATGIGSNGDLKCQSLSSLVNNLPTTPPPPAPVYSGPRFSWNSGSFSTVDQAEVACRQKGKALARSADVTQAVAAAKSIGKKLMDVLGLPSGQPALIWTSADSQKQTGMQNLYLPGHDTTESVPVGTATQAALCL